MTYTIFFHSFFSRNPRLFDRETGSLTFAGFTFDFSGVRFSCFRCSFPSTLTLFRLSATDFTKQLVSSSLLSISKSTTSGTRTGWNGHETWVFELPIITFVAVPSTGNNLSPVSREFAFTSMKKNKELAFSPEFNSLRPRLHRWPLPLRLTYLQPNLGTAHVW